MRTIAEKFGWFFYFVLTLSFPVVMGAALFEGAPDMLFVAVFAVSLLLAIQLSANTSQTARNHSALLSGIAAIGAFLAARVIAFDAHCWQNGLGFCHLIEPPLWEWPQHILRADGHFGEEIAVFQMWIVYFLAITIPAAIIALSVVRKRRADL